MPFDTVSFDFSRQADSGVVCHCKSSALGYRPIEIRSPHGIGS